MFGKSFPKKLSKLLPSKFYWYIDMEPSLPIMGNLVKKPLLKRYSIIGSHHYWSFFQKTFGAQKPKPQRAKFLCLCTFTDLWILTDLWIYGLWWIFGLNYGFENSCISKDHLARKGNFSLSIWPTIRRDSLLGLNLLNCPTS